MGLTVLVYPLLALLLFIGAKFAKRGEFFEDYASLKTAKCVQGFAAVGVIIHHLGQKFSNFGALPVPLNFFNDMGAYFVSIFFFFSGLGLIKSFNEKEGYLKGFLWKRLVTVLLPFYIINLTYILVNIFADGARYSFGRFMADLIGLRLVSGDGWYVITAVVLYIVFFLLFRYVKNEKARYIGISAFVLAYCAGVLFMGHGDGSTLFQGEWWFNATPSFILGVFWARFEKPVFSFAKKHYAWLTPLAAALTVGGWFLNRYALSNISYWNEYPGYPGYKEKWICFAVQAVALPLFVATIMLIGMKLKVNNRALSFLGGITLEVYLIHRHFITLFYERRVIGNEFLATLAVVACGVLAGWLVHLLCGVIKKPLLGLGEKRAAVTASADKDNN